MDMVKPNLTKRVKSQPSSNSSGIDTLYERGTNQFRRRQSKAIESEEEFETDSDNEGNQNQPKYLCNDDDPNYRGLLKNKPIWEVEAILDKRLGKKRKGKQRRRSEYLVKWTNYDKSENSWEPKTSFIDAKEILKSFETRWQIEHGIVASPQVGGNVVSPPPQPPPPPPPNVKSHTTDMWRHSGFITMTDQAESIVLRPRK